MDKADGIRRMPPRAFDQGPEKPQVYTVEDPRAKLRRRAFEAGIRYEGQFTRADCVEVSPDGMKVTHSLEPWWAELAPLTRAERDLVRRAVEQDREIKNRERSKAPSIGA